MLAAALERPKDYKRDGRRGSKHIDAKSLVTTNTSFLNGLHFHEDPDPSL